jgi:NAD(P)-dependent dehydrogenase (short-subunit alcohol dehydrogenase family)
VLASCAGIGRATAVELSHAGWTVVLVARREHHLRDAALLCSTSVDVAREPGDVTDEAFVDGLFARVLVRFGACAPLPPAPALTAQAASTSSSTCAPDPRRVQGLTGRIERGRVRAAGPDRGHDARVLPDRDRHEPDGLLPLHARRHPRVQGAVPTRRYGLLQRDA